MAVLIHGGFWRAFWGRDLMRPIAQDLVSRGWAVWNVEYRRVGAGGGWPMTLRDVGTAADLLHLLAYRHPFDLHRLVVIGHSAGGQLAWWLAARCRRNVSNELGGRGIASPMALVGLAPILDLVEAEERALGSHAAAEFLGGIPAAFPERYQAASPVAHAPFGLGQLIVHGSLDDRVPLEMSERFVAAARAAGDQAELITLEHSDHFALIDPWSEHWERIVAAVGSLVS